MNPQKQIKRSQWDHGSLIKTSTSYPPPPPKEGNFQHKTSFEKVGFGDVNETMEEFLWDRGSGLSGYWWDNKNDYWLSFPLKGNHIKDKYICKHYIHYTIYHIYIMYIVTRKRYYLRETLAKQVGFCGLTQGTKANYGNWRIEYLGEFEAICKTALVRESGPYRGGYLMKTAEGRKSRDTVTFIYYHLVPAWWWGVQGL
jgi:hypothetical protein